MDTGPVTEGSEKREEARKWWLRESRERKTCYTQCRDSYHDDATVRYRSLKLLYYCTTIVYSKLLSNNVQILQLAV